MTADVFATLTKLAPQAKTLLVAVSGGGDSVALLRLLVGGPYQLEVAHVDHALREASADDARFVEDLAKALQLPFYGVRLDVARIAAQKGWNVEDAARRLRYSFLTRTAKRVGADAILTAHTQNDQAETVLLQLLRGAAYATGIPARRGRVVRPLLGVSRQQLRTYLETLEQPYQEDDTNADTKRTRAWLRHEVMPVLTSRYPAVPQKLAQFAALQRDQAAALQTQAERFSRRGFYGEGLGTLHLRAQPPALQRAALAAFLQQAGLPPDFEHLETLRHSLDAVKPTQISLPRDRLARIAYGRLELMTSASPISPLSSAEPKVTEIDPADSSLAELRPELDLGKLAAFPGLYMRARVPGDRLRLPGGRKKVADLLIDRKVPREHRDSLAVLATDPVGPSEVLWVEGIAADVRVALSVNDPAITWMKRALAQAEQAALAGEVPVGAVVVREGKPLAEAANTTRSDADPTAHAELKVLREAAKVLGDWRLTDCTLYVTLEPCPMCLGAALNAHLPRLVYGAVNRRDGALGGVANLLENSWKRGLEVRSGVLARDAERLLQDFFTARRGAP